MKKFSLIVLVITFLLAPTLTSLRAQDQGTNSGAQNLTQFLDQKRTNAEFPSRQISEAYPAGLDRDNSDIRRSPFDGSANNVNDVRRIVNVRDLSAVKGDLNRDGRIDFSDLTILNNSFGPCNEESVDSCRADIDGNGVIDSADAAAISDRFSQFRQNTSELMSALKRCEQIENEDEQKRCLMKTSQEKEVEARAKDLIPALREKMGNRGLEQSTEVRINNYLRFMHNMMARITAAIERLEILSGRIETKIQELEADGQNVEASKILLQAAIEKIERAKSQQAGISGSYDQVITADNLKEGYANLRQQVESLKETIKNAHQTLIEAVKQLKGSESGSDKSETNSAEDINS